MRRQAKNPYTRRQALAAAGIAAAALATSAPAEQQGDAVTISMSGATFMRAFTTSPGFTFLIPGTSITLNSSAGGAPVTYSAAPGAGTQVSSPPATWAGQSPPTPRQATRR